MTQPTDDIQARLDLARTAAIEAGRLTLEFFQREDLAVDRKDDRSPVTEADRQAEKLLREQITLAFPDDGIVGEEFGEQPGTSPFRWILDPIDGTKSFICGVPLFGTLIGVEHENRSVVGVINIAALGECVYAAAGGGAWYEKKGAKPQAARVSSRQTLAEAVFLTSQVDGFAGRDALAVYLDIERQAAITRTWGDCYGYLLVATGRADVMVDPEMHIWDAAALQPIIEEAGGRFSDWGGAPSIYSGESVATNGKIHDEVLAVTRPFAKSR